MSTELNFARIAVQRYKSLFERQEPPRFISISMLLDPDADPLSRYGPEPSSVADPDPPDPHVFGPPGSGSFYH
jgi:hypothetical protein